MLYPYQLANVGFEPVSNDFKRVKQIIQEKIISTQLYSMTLKN